MEGNNQPVVADGKHKVEDGTAFNLKWLVSTILAIWPWLLGSIIIALIIGNLYLRYTQPIYRSSAEMLITDSKVNGSGPDNFDIIETSGKIVHGKWGDTIQLTPIKAVLRKTASFTPDKVQYTINIWDMSTAGGAYTVDINLPGKSASFIYLSM